MTFCDITGRKRGRRIACTGRNRATLYRDIGETQTACEVDPCGVLSPTGYWQRSWRAWGNPEPGLPWENVARGRAPIGHAAAVNFLQLVIVIALARAVVELVQWAT